MSRARFGAMLIEGKGGESLAETSTLVDEDFIALSCSSSISEAATEKEDVLDEQTSSKEALGARPDTKVLEPTITPARYISDVVKNFPSPLPEILAPSFLWDAFRKPFSRSDDALQKAVDKSNEIDRAIEQDKAQRNRTTKILLLGPGGGGKSTLLKQMTRLFRGPFSIEQRKEARENILAHIIQGCRLAIEQMKDQKINFDTAENEEAAQIMLEMETTSPVHDLPTNCYTGIQTLAKDKGLRTVLQGGYRLGSYDNMIYFFDNLERIAQSDYTPNEEDVLLSRTRLFGISETYFRREYTKQDFYVYDLGGACGERKKWIHFFEDIDIVVVVTPIDTYYQCFAEDRNMSLMRESLVLFDSIANSGWFKQRNIVLSLTKLDCLVDALKRHSIQDWWPDYVGDPQSETEVVQFFTDKFLSYNTNKERKVVVKALSLIDTNTVYRFLEDEILKPRQNLESS